MSPDPWSEWRRQGRWLDLFGLQVFVVERGSEGATPLAVLHGFPTSSHDFELVLPRLAASRRVILLDFPGFGLSAKPRDYSYSLMEQADVALSVWRRLGLSRVHLLAHDYGTSVATELLARRERDLLPIELETVTLCNGSPHIELAHLTTTQRVLRQPLAGSLLARLSTERFFHARMRGTLGDPDSVSRQRLHAMWRAVRELDGHLRLPAISGYLAERTRFWSRWIGAVRRLDRPAHVVWGRRDPIAVPAIAQALHDEIEDCRLTWLDGVGHYPMLEDPAAWSAAVNGFLGEHEPASD